MTNEARNWLFGDKAGLTFPGATPLSGSAMTTNEGCSAISDPSGGLLFYTDGTTVWNGANAVMAGGTGLQGNSSATQSALIVPWPQTGCRKYFIFTVDAAERLPANYGICYSVVDLGLTIPGVSVKNVALMPGTFVTEKLTAVSDQNGGFWVLTHGWNNNNFYAFHVTAFGVSGPVISSIGTIHSSSNLYNFQGALKASPDATRVACAVRGSAFVELFAFNPVNGVVTALIKNWPITQSTNPSQPGVPYGLEFSPDSTKLYVTTTGTSPADLFQLDLISLGSLIHIDSTIGTGNYYDFGALQLASDQKIYMARYGQTSIAVIDKPNVLFSNFASIGYNATGVPLPSGSLSRLGLPAIVQGDFTCQSCTDIETDLNADLAKDCSHKFNKLASCAGKVGDCQCGSAANGQSEKCSEIAIPNLAPCISVSWGDSVCDCIETDDTEVLCITVCNCYSNVTFSDLSIGFLNVTTSTGAEVPNLPDGSPSVEVLPRGPICFGDIGPCKEGSSNCVSRQFVLISRGAKGGSYQLQVGGICFEVCFHYQQKACFQLNLCADR